MVDLGIQGGYVFGTNPPEDTRMQSEVASELARKLRVASVDQQARLLHAHTRLLMATSWNNLKNTGVMDAIVDISISAPSLSVGAMRVLQVAIEFLAKHIDGLASTTSLQAFVNSKFPPFIRQVFYALRSVNSANNEALYMKLATQGGIIMAFLFREVAYCHDPVFVSAIDYDDTMEFIYATLLHPGYWGPSSQSLEQVNALPNYGFIYEIFPPDQHVTLEPAQKAVATHGAEAIAARFSDIFKDDARMRHIAAHLAAVLLETFFPILEVAKACLEGGLTITLMRRSWRNLRSEGSKTYFGPAQCLGLVKRFIGAAVVRRPPSRADATAVLEAMNLHDMIVEEDLIPLIGKSLLTDAMLEAGHEEDIFWFYRMMNAASVNETRKAAIRDDWLHVYEGLVALNLASDCLVDARHRNALESWQKFGALMSYDVDQLRREAVARTGVTPIGCGRLECPLYLDKDASTVREMLRCSRCKQTQYCGFSCQRLDWLDGGHREVCQAEAVRSRPWVTAIINFPPGCGPELVYT